jgi:hypothetical protein
MLSVINQPNLGRGAVSWVTFTEVFRLIAIALPFVPDDPWAHLVFAFLP